MTLGDIKRQILNLGFETKETYDEEPTIITDALNYAMRDITNLFPLTGIYSISQISLENRISNNSMCYDVTRYDGNSAISFTANNVKSYYFECDGIGTATIVDGTGANTIEMASTRKYVAYSGFVSGNATISFSGLYAYNVKNVAMYAEKLSDKVEDIPPFKKAIRYDLKEMTKDGGKVKFIEFLDKVEETNKYGECYRRLISDFRIENKSTIVLDGSKSAQFTLFYKKTFTEFSKETLDTMEIELPFEQQHLLPLLAAYYIWLDDDERKASMYYNRYENAANIITANMRKVIATVESDGDF